MEASDGKTHHYVFPGMITTAQAAAILGTSAHYVKRLRALGVLRPAVIVHEELLLLRESDVIEYRNSHPLLGSRRKL